ncbi:GNAT family N-acetyltransferase [Ensifer adhaerens]|nr:GNAT family N-acetyltransferase [Ensifer adhaerens]MBZ7924874.1 GNAT family N-acetyltransferase [Ensifer adhaerens]UAX95911.1 GNAT family N-acetyltransferase [Ensifer adhaerens]UAY10178.1 GNAT family N-acetyltransferase [Ensifer adhaerens]
MYSSDIAAAHALSNRLRWPHRAEDWEQMYRLCRGVVIETPEAEVIGTSLAFLQGDVGTIGLVIVDPRYQGMRLGRRLMEASLSLTGRRSVVLNATDAGVPLYRKLGFEETGAVSQIQGSSAFSTGGDTRDRIRAATADDLEKLVVLASSAAGFDRREVITTYFASANSTVVYMENAGLAGFGICRRFGHGYQIGPVVAANSEQAREIVTALLADVRGEFVRIDCPEHDELASVLGPASLRCVGQVRTMCRGKLVLPQSVRQFAIASQALG